MITESRYFRLRRLDLTNSSTVASGGGTTTVNIRPDEGWIRQIVGIDASYPAIGGASGDHKLEIRQTNGSWVEEFAQLTGTDGAAFSINRRNGFTASSETPSSETYQRLIIHSGEFYSSNTNYIEFLYTNSSDTNQTGSRQLVVLVKEYPEAFF